MHHTVSLAIDAQARSAASCLIICMCVYRVRIWYCEQTSVEHKMPGTQTRHEAIGPTLVEDDLPLFIPPYRSVIGQAMKTPSDMHALRRMRTTRSRGWSQAVLCRPLDHSRSKADFRLVLFLCTSLIFSPRGIRALLILSITSCMLILLLLL